MLVLCDTGSSIPLRDRSVHCVVTSPPYWALRDYGDPRQIGLEPTPDAYVARMVAVFREVRRVLRDDGTLWLNIGDSYGGDRGNKSPAPDSKNLALGAGSVHGHAREFDARKQLIGIPWRLALALQSDGWYLRSDVIWCLSGGTKLWVKSRKGVMPMSVKDMVRLDPRSVQLWNGEKWTQVLGWNRSGVRGEPLEIVLRSGQRIGCTPGHVWPTQRGNVRADELRPGDVIRSTTLPGPPVADDPAMMPDVDVGWLVGLYIAEGSRDSGGTIQIASHTKETTRIDRLMELARNYHGTCRVHVHGENACTINLDGPMLRAIIDQYVAGRTAKDKHLKTAAWQRSAAFIGAVLDGYLGGDGHYDAVNDRWRLGFTSNDSWADDLRAICARLGVSLRLRRKQHQFDGRSFPGYGGEIRFQRTGHANNRPDAEIVEIGRSRGRTFWDIGVEDEPHLFALASGVLTHNSKPNPMPESVTDRPTKAHEYIFLLTKRGRYFYDAAAERTPHVRLWEPETNGRGLYGASAARPNKHNDLPVLPHPDGANLRTVWSMSTRPYPGAHFATFTPELPARCIRLGTSERGCCPACGAPHRRVTAKERRPTRPGVGSKAVGLDAQVIGNRDPSRHVTSTRTIGWEPGCGCDAGDPVPCVVLDPFSGSGTTVVVARELGRIGVGLDVSRDYMGLAVGRIREGIMVRRRKPKRPASPSRGGIQFTLFD